MLCRKKASQIKEKRRKISTRKMKIVMTVLEKSLPLGTSCIYGFQAGKKEEGRGNGNPGWNCEVPSRSPSLILI